MLANHVCVYARMHLCMRLAGPITPAYHAIQCRWKQIRGIEYRESKQTRYLGDARVPDKEHRHVYDCKVGARCSACITLFEMEPESCMGV